MQVAKFGGEGLILGKLILAYLRKQRASEGQQPVPRPGLTSARTYGVSFSLILNSPTRMDA